MTTACRITLAVTFAALLSTTSCRQEKKTHTLTEVVRRAERVVLYEGLPHQMYESRLLEEERQTKAVHELNNYPFYQEPLALAAEDAKRLNEILGDSSTYKPFSGEKKCGGFHPDYAVEWRVGEDCYRVLICFGCHEAKLFGPGLESRNDLNEAAYRKLRELLKDYRKNRPARKSQE